MQAAIRSIVAAVLLLVWSYLTSQRLLDRDGTLVVGIAAGLLFAFEFVFIYAGLAHTNASRMSVFVYLAPPLTALGLHFFVAGERLGALQWGGVLVAFCGLVLAFAEGFSSNRNTFWGDLCGVVAAAFWASTTVLIRATRLARARHQDAFLPAGRVRRGFACCIPPDGRKRRHQRHAVGIG
jgi:drug/metabolite transporter (DMT)-like permease